MIRIAQPLIGAEEEQAVLDAGPLGESPGAQRLEDGLLLFRADERLGDADHIVLALAGSKSNVRPHALQRHRLPSCSTGRPQVQT